MPVSNPEGLIPILTWILAIAVIFLGFEIVRSAIKGLRGLKISLPSPLIDLRGLRRSRSNRRKANKNIKPKEKPVSTEKKGVEAGRNVSPDDPSSKRSSPDYHIIADTRKAMLYQVLLFTLIFLIVLFTSAPQLRTLLFSFSIDISPFLPAALISMPASFILTKILYPLIYRLEIEMWSRAI